jgi:filamentous hemagglutinin
MAGGAAQHLPPGIPGYRGEEREKGDGLIVDNATELNESLKAGMLVTLPPPVQVGLLITEAAPDSIKQLVEGSHINRIRGPLET